MCGPDEASYGQEEERRDREKHGDSKAGSVYRLTHKFCRNFLTSGWENKLQIYIFRANHLTFIKPSKGGTRKIYEHVLETLKIIHSCGA